MQIMCYPSDELLCCGDMGTASSRLNALSSFAGAVGDNDAPSARRGKGGSWCGRWCSV